MIFSTKLIAATLLLSSIFLCNKVGAQCNPTDKNPVNVVSIVPSMVTCPQNGTITVNGVSGGGGEYVYEIFYGPILRGIQSQNVFAALLPGKYRVRVTGCNSTFYESDTITVGNVYLEPAAHTLNFIADESFKCGVTNNGRVALSLTLTLPTLDFNDTQYYKLPLRYQVSTNGDPATGFNTAPYKTLTNSMLVTRTGGRGPSRFVLKQDTITGLQVGTTYYVRITDQCGVFKTVAITLPNTVTNNFTYSFTVKEPYQLSLPHSTDYPPVKGNCVQWGDLVIFNNGSPINSINAASPNAPLTAILKRQDNGDTISLRKFTSGSLNKVNTFGYNSTNLNNLLFDSIPRIPVVLEIKDQCGLTTTIPISTPSTKVPFRLQAFNSCAASMGSYCFLNTINAAPSLPIQFKVYDASNNLIVNKILGTFNYQYIRLANTNPLCCNQETIVPSLGEYRFVYEDNCGLKDSLVFNFGTGGAFPVPNFTFTPIQKKCSPDGVNRFIVDVVQTTTSPVVSINITAGPSSLRYPIALKAPNIAFNISNGGMTYVNPQKKYFDSLLTGTYQVAVVYGCNQVYNTSFTIASGITTNVTASLTLTPQSNVCSSVGSTVSGQIIVNGPDFLDVINDSIWMRITNAPLNFLQSITVSKNGSAPTLPLVLGDINAWSYLLNGVDSNSLMVYPKFAYSNLCSGSFSFPQGNYTFEMYTKCTGRVLDSKSFTITESGYNKPNLGASSGYICDAGEVKVIASPLNGRRPFRYQIKLAADPNDANFTPMQNDSVFVIPSSTPPGTVYTIRAIDACNNSFVGQVVVNSFTGNLYISYTNDCVGRPARIITGYIPGAIYTWKKPDGTTIITNSNELYIANFAIEDIGVYTVTAAALDGCISKGAGSVIGSRCYSVLPVNFNEFLAKKINENQVQLNWDIASEINVNSFDIERSIDGYDWKKVGNVPAVVVNGIDGKTYDYKDVFTETNKSPVYFYRIKAMNVAGKVNYSTIRKIYFSNDFQILKVYPTPFVNAVSIDFMSESNEKVCISLFDLNGREVSRSVMPAVKGINNFQYAPIMQIESGAYMLVLTQGNNRYTTKVLKSK